MALIRPRDFIETKEGLLFSAISPKIAFLRYFPSEKGERKRGKRRYQKVASTSSSFEYLEENYPQYIAEESGYRLQRCPIEKVSRIYRPVEKLRELKFSKDTLAEKCLALSEILEDIPKKNKGVTGSLLVDLHTPSSDIDFVVYGNAHFETARRAIGRSKAVKPLGEEEWRRYYKKRFQDQSPFDFETFLWHEQRKFNVGLIEGTIFNLLLVGDEIKLCEAMPLKRVKIRCRVKDARQAFNLPSLYAVEHELVEEVISFTHTYAGQAKEGEEIEVAGMLEKTQKGYRIVVGTTREAENEYIKVIGH